MSVAVKKIPGVESTKVSLNEGKVWIQLKSGNSVNMEQIRRAIIDQGFTPKEAKVEAIGQIGSLNGQLQFAVTNSKDVYRIAQTPHANWSGQSGKQIAVSALVPAREDSKPEEIQITKVEGQAAPPSSKD